MKQIIGSWAFLIGVILAVILGLVNTNANGTIEVILVILGLIIGFLNITDKEVEPFLMSGTVLVIVSHFGGIAAETLEWFGGILGAMMFIFVPATIIVALKSVFSMAKH